MTDSIIRYNFESNHAKDDSDQIWLNLDPVVCRREDWFFNSLHWRVRWRDTMLWQKLIWPFV